MNEVPVEPAVESDSAAADSNENATVSRRPSRPLPEIPFQEPRRRGPRGLFKPQHRLTLFLIAGASGALVLTLLFPAKTDAPSTSRAAVTRAAAEPVEWPREYGATVALARPAEQAQVAPALDLDGAMARVVPAVNRCADAHQSALAPLDGRVFLRLTVGGTGLKDAVLVDVADADVDAVACLAAAAWGAGWPTGLSEQAVTFPFYVVAPHQTEPPADAPPAAGVGLQRRDDVVPQAPVAS